MARRRTNREETEAERMFKKSRKAECALRAMGAPQLFDPDKRRGEVAARSLYSDGVS